MDPTTGILVTIIVVLAAVAAFLFWRYRGSTRLRSQFGPEYARTVEESGSRRTAEERLRRREQRVRSYSISELTPDQRVRYAASWRAIQAEFVDDPRGAVTSADRLLRDVMSTRGYPVLDFEQQAADLSVDHPVVVQNYRAAHETALRHEEGRAGTEELRQAIVHYRTLFDELVGEPGGSRLKAAS